MKILLINYEFPPVGSGAANASRHAAREFALRGHDVVVLTSRVRGLARREAREGYRVERIPVLRSRMDRCAPHELLSFVSASIPAALALARRERFDVTLAYFGFPCGPAAWAVKRALGVPYVVSLRNADVPRPALSEHRLLQIPMKALVRRVWRKADAVVAVSAGLADEAKKIEPSVEFGVIPNGVDTTLFRPLAAAREPGPVRLLYVGRLREFKGLQDLLPAMKGLDVQLELVGDGPYRSELHSLAESLGISDRIRFRGRKPREEMPGVYRRADIFTFPTYAEGMPNAVLEALASGLPVVATDIEGSRELVRSGIDGALVPTRSPDALKAALVELLASPEKRTAQGRAARERAEQFSWGNVADAYLSLLDRCKRKGGG